MVDQKTGEPELGLYVTGWAKRGPTGIIGEPSAQVCEYHARIPGHHALSGLCSAGHVVLRISLVRDSDCKLWMHWMQQQS